FPTRGQRYRMPLGMERVGIQIAHTRDELTLALRTQTRHFEIQAARTIGFWIIEIEISTRMINKASPVTAEMPCVEIFVARVTAHILAIRRTGINVTNTFMIGEEVDTLTNPARISDVAIEP